MGGINKINKHSNFIRLIKMKKLAKEFKKKTRRYF